MNYSILIAVPVVLFALSAGAPAAVAAPTVIELTQVACQFLESEGGTDHDYASSSAEQCAGINAETGAARVAAAAPLRLPAGDYVFRVTNRDVPWSLGFWVRGDGLLARARLPSTSGGGLESGMTRDYPITLTAGEYVYSCPLNPTPDYRLVVTE